jgi:hypothetical protein
MLAAVHHHTRPMNLITRNQYLTIGGRQAHREYYSQFVTPAHKVRILQFIGLDRLKKSEDTHFNDIPLELWDSLAVPIPAESAKFLKECGDYPTLAGAVCILKECARQMLED